MQCITQLLAQLLDGCGMLPVQAAVKGSNNGPCRGKGEREENVQQACESACVYTVHD